MSFTQFMSWVIFIVMVLSIVAGIYLLFQGACISYENVANWRNPFRAGDRAGVKEVARWEKAEIFINQVDSFGYVEVAAGEEVCLPVVNEKCNQEVFPFANAFEIVGILGNYLDDSVKMTNFTNGEVWLVLQKYGQAPTKFFILQWRIKSFLDNLKADKADDERDRQIAILQKQYEDGEFFDDKDRPIIKPTGKFVYLVSDYRWVYDVKPEMIIPDRSDEELSFVSFLKVNDLRGKPALAARVFGPNERGRLQLILDEKVVGYYGREGEDRDVREVFFKLKIVDKKDLKSLPDLEKCLPNPVQYWFDSDAMKSLIKK